MSEHPHRNLPLLEQMAIHVPGYGGYFDRSRRRAADQALREAIAGRLVESRTRIDRAIQECLARDEQETSGVPEAGAHRLLTEVGSLNRLGQHLDRVINLVRLTASGTDAFYQAGHLDVPRANALHAFDLALLRRTDALFNRFDAPDLEHNFLADLESDLNQFEQKLGERTLLFAGMR